MATRKLPQRLEIESLGSKIELLMNALKAKTIKDLAKITDVSARTLDNWRTESTRPLRSSIQKLCDTISWFTLKQFVEYSASEFKQLLENQSGNTLPPATPALDIPPSLIGEWILFINPERDLTIRIRRTEAVLIKEGIIEHPCVLLQAKSQVATLIIDTGKDIVTLKLFIPNQELFKIKGMLLETMPSNEWTDQMEKPICYSFIAKKKTGDKKMGVSEREKNFLQYFQFKK